MEFRFCSILATAEGEPIEGTAPEKDAAIFLPAQKKFWHRISASEKIQGFPEKSDLGQTIVSFKRPLISYYLPNDLTGDLIFVAESSGIKCFSNSGIRIQRDVKHLYAICTDGKKDACCSKFGIPIAKSFSKNCKKDEYSISFETSHIGGCRFAATAVCFPSGNSYGRILPDHVVEIKNSEESGFIVSKIFRGNVFVSEIHCWIMGHSMKKFGYVPTPDQTKVVKKGDLFHITITPDQRSEFKFGLIHREKKLNFFSGCSNIESGRSITRSIYDLVQTHTL